ncbi:MAG: hypothetical protein FWF51_08720 [Chitinivibrionia bacterium]|nr:hypothetical protein [Chitinivibrionia bacterium]
MKKTVLVVFAICALCFSFATAKNMSIKLTNAQVDEYIAKNPDLPDYDKSCLLTGDYKVGIKAETLKLMLGNPKKIVRIKQPWAEQEEWFYKVNKSKLYFTIEKDGVVGIEERN